MVGTMFSIYDKKSEVFFQPRFGRNREAFKRDIVLELKNAEKSPFVEYADDYELYEIGSFCDHDGKVEPTIPPSRVCSLGELLRD